MSDESNQKRKRTDSEGKSSNDASVPPWITGASPPRFVSMGELMNAAKDLDKMALAHEIAVNDEFTLKVDEKPAEGTIQRQVHDAMHKAFWDKLQQQIDADPPEYDDVLQMVHEIKENLFSLLLPQHTKLKSEINERLDMDFLRQQLKQGVLEFQKVGAYILEIMAKLCAPIRDPQIAQLTHTEQIIPLLRGIFQNLDAMKIDMANYTITSNKPVIVENSVEYEREKFESYLANNPGGLRHTEAWLQQALLLWRAERPSPSPANKIAAVARTHNENDTNKVPCQPLPVPNTSNATGSEMPTHGEWMTRAYLELLRWFDHRAFPETLLVDQARLYDMRNVCQQLVVCASCVMICNADKNRLHINADEQFRARLKDRLLVLLTDVQQRQFSERLPALAEEIVNEVKKEATAPIEASTLDTIRASIIDLQDPRNHVRRLIRSRVLSFVRQVISKPGASPIKLPTGLGLIQSELAKLTGLFLRLVSHNRAIFAPHYTIIMDRLLQGVPAPVRETQSSEISGGSGGHATENHVNTEEAHEIMDATPKTVEQPQILQGNDYQLPNSSESKQEEH